MKTLREMIDLIESAQTVAEGNPLNDEIKQLFKPVVLQIVKWAQAEGMTADDLEGTSSHYTVDALDDDIQDQIDHLPDQYFNRLMDKANAKAVEILRKQSVAEGQLEETTPDAIEKVETLFRK